MAYPDDEKSVEDSAPREIYVFATPAATYRLTSYDTGFIFDDLFNPYVPTTMKRGPVAGTTGTDIPDLEIELPADVPVVADNAYNPPQTFTVTVRRVQPISGAAIYLWEGSVASIVIEGDKAKMRIPSLVGDAFSRPIPGTGCQRLCNHDLYGEICRVDKDDASFKTTTTISTINGKILTVASVGGHPDKWFRAGFVRRVVDGERRMIVSQTGLSLVLDAPFKTLAVGNSVDLHAGCDHTVEVCDSKFDNVDNYGGHPWVPTIDPFRVGFRGAFA